MRPSRKPGGRGESLPGTGGRRPRPVVCALLAALFVLAGPARADTEVSVTNLNLFQSALSAGGLITFTDSGTLTLTNTQVITTDVTIDGSDQSVVISGRADVTISTNTTTDITVQTNCHTFFYVTNVVITDPFTGLIVTNQVQTNATICTNIYYTNITSEVVISADGFRLFTVNPGVQFSLNNLTLIKGVSTNGGAVLNQGALFVSNCVFTGNGAVGVSGTDGLKGSDSASRDGGNGGNGSSGVSGRGGVIYNLGDAVHFAQPVCHQRRLRRRWRRWWQRGQRRLEWGRRGQRG